VRFVAFVNEEPPFFTSGEMGSRVYARACRARNDDIVAMLSLETIGYYSDAPRSQAYPAPFGLLYPDTGNFVTFVANYRSRPLLHQVMSAFRANAQFPSEGAAAPEWIPGVGWSDHWSFWKEGYPGVMVTDTALFRYPHYHTSQDTPEKLDYPRMARVFSGLQQVMRALAESAGNS
jgi:Zn-dependent M28 family amino/carboxypeptidase